VAILYNSYLGLFQALAGAVQKNGELESAGWTNLRNLLRRVGKAPGLDKRQQEFEHRFQAELDSLQIPADRIVDRNRTDRERTFHLMLLQALLSGKAQADGTPQNRFDLDQMRGWPIYFRIDQDGVWGAS